MTSSSIPLTLTTTTWGFGLAELWPRADIRGKSKTQDANTKTANRRNTMDPPTSIRAGDENSRRIDGIIAHSGTLLAEAPVGAHGPDQAVYATERIWHVSQKVFERNGDTLVRAACSKAFSCGPLPRCVRFTSQLSIGIG
jgi:hypothetical protein